MSFKNGDFSTPCILHKTYTANIHDMGTKANTANLQKERTRTV